MKIRIYNDNGVRRDVAHAEAEIFLVLGHVNTTLLNGQANVSTSFQILADLEPQGTLTSEEEEALGKKYVTFLLTAMKCICTSVSEMTGADYSDVLKLIKEESKTDASLISLPPSMLH